MKILFLDLDGTVRQPKSGAKFINDPEDQEIIPGADKAIAHFKNQDWMLIGVTNQGGVAAGHKSIQDAIQEQKITLEIAGLELIYFSPTYDGLECYKITNQAIEVIKQYSVQEFGSFRKPGPGMLNLPLKFLGVQPQDCWMVGDRVEDEQAAAAAGVSFCPADVWRSRFCAGLHEHSVTKAQLEFLESVKL